MLIFVYAFNVYKLRGVKFVLLGSVSILDTVSPQIIRSVVVADPFLETLYYLL